jgi:hypothetical protein
MGVYTTASGDFSTAMGGSTTASDFASLVIGRYNSSGSSVTSSATAFSTANTAFVIGNGTGGNASDAFKVMFNGDAYVYNTLYLGGTAITSTAAELNILGGVTSTSAELNLNDGSSAGTVVNSKAVVYGSAGEVNATTLQIAGTAITSTAAELNLLNGVTAIGSGILGSVTEGSSTGVRLSTSTAANHGDIGSNAVDLSYQANSSSSRGATGRYSTAAGEATTASGESSTALGYYSVASGGYGAIAMGNQTTASGDNSTVMGEGGTASGAASTAMGRGTTASDYASLVIGQYNSSGSSVTINATSFDTANTAFVIGNGVDGSNTSNAFKVLFNGDTTVSNDLTVNGDVVVSSDVYAAGLNIGGTAITSTAAELNLLNGVTAIGSGILGSVTEGSSTGVRLSTSTAANHGDIGSNAVDLSYQANSSSSRGATGRYSTAAGEATTASGESSTALGYYSVASGGYGAIAMGNQTTASGDNSTVMGEGGTASGAASTAMGRGTTASDYASLVIGQYNSSGSSVTINATSFDTANTAFVIGNGVDGSNTSNAFKVLFNGDTTVSNDLTVNGDVVVSSDARLKANIVSLGSTLARLLLIDGKSYTMKKDGKQKIGVLAQDIQKVFPELVSEDSNEMLAVNYQGLVPVLINALKEQDDKISRLEVLVEKLMSDKKQ